MNVPYSRALVTGATGFIGRLLIKQLAAQGVAVHAMVLPGTEPGELAELEHVTIHEGDITDVARLQAIVAEAAPEVIFHLAAYGTFSHEKDVQRMIDVNVSGTYQLLHLAQEFGCQAFVYAGSVKEYPTGRTPLTEAAPLKPWDEYAVTKAASQVVAQFFAEHNHVPVTVLRLSPAYGPGDAAARFVLSAMRAALNGEPFTMSVGHLVRNFTYVEDIVQAFLLAATREAKGYEVFNIGSPEPHSFADLITAIEAATEQKIALTTTPPVPGAPDDSWVVDSSKAKQLLGWEPHVSLEQGMQLTLAWYQDQLHGKK